MNNTLKKEIIAHIFKTVGILTDPGIMNVSMMDRLIDGKFLLTKKIAFEMADEKTKENDIWAATAKVENSEIKIIIADITEGISEFALIVRMDNFLPCAIKLSEEANDFGSMHVNVKDNRWIEATTNLQGKILSGFESLTEIYLQWTKLDDYSDMYKSLIGFLNSLE